MLKDFRGRPIQVNDLIVYPGRKSSSMWMTEAQVKTIIYNTDEPNRRVTKLHVQPIKNNVPFGKSTWLHRLDLVIRVDAQREPMELRTS